MSPVADIDARPAADSAAPRGSARAGRVGSDVAGLGRSRGFLLTVPALVLIGIFLVFPALWTLYLGVLRYSLTGATAAHPQFVGLHNYISALTDPRFLGSLKITLVFVLLSAVVGQSLLGFAVAWRVRGLSRWIKSVLEALILMAWILPGSVVVFLWQALLNRQDGTLNAILHTPGTAWLLDHPLAVIIVFNVWRGTAFSMLLFSAAIANVPTSQLETARVAGATAGQQLRDVVFPHIRGHVLTNTLLISLWTFNDFTPYLLTGGGPDHRSETLPVYIYRTSLEGGQLGYGSAISLIMLVINLVVALVYIRLLRERR